MKKIYPVLALSLLGVSSWASAQVDLSGTWDNGSGIDFLAPQIMGDSICVIGCGPAPESAESAIPEGPRPSSGPPSRPVYKAEFQAKVADLEERQVEEDTVLRCYPPGVPRIGPPDKIVQTDTEIVFLYDDVSGNFFRIIPIDGRGHRDDVELSFLGDAIGWWQDDVLVVESNQFNDETWLVDDGAFHTTDLVVEEHLYLEDGFLVWEATAFDPAVLAEPWQAPVRRSVPAQGEIHEAALCVERDLEHVVDGTHHDNGR